MPRLSHHRKNVRARPSRLRTLLLAIVLSPPRAQSSTSLSRSSDGAPVKPVGEAAALSLRVLGLVYRAQNTSMTARAVRRRPEVA